MPLTHRKQPLRRLLTVHGIKITEAARFIGCTTSHLRSVISGHAYPSDLVREKLPELFHGLPVNIMFDPEHLEGEYTGPRGAERGGRRG
ncbi:hypothetical protein [Agromyces sp. GXS1127]|uniref:hypothetical protein n=1 Tax=Agromyces sp. GXS1127 TaxID=3424181 RepID=UPI003D320E0C